MSLLQDNIQGCTKCADRFAATATGHAPRPVVWFNDTARVLIAGQAPGQKVHRSGRPFTDPSGDRLRDWLGIDADTFYDRNRIAIVPMAFCFPGYSASGSDLPPPAICAQSWRAQVMARLASVRLRILVGSYALRWHLGTGARVGDIVADWARWAPDTFVLPHPSWRNTAWLKQNPYFKRDVLPALKSRIARVLADDP